MKPKTWIFIIAIVLLIAMAIVGYVAFKLVQKNNLNAKLIVPPDLKSFHVDIRDYGFIPENMTIDIGEEVVWKNFGIENHSIVFSSLNISSGLLKFESNYSVVFNSSGNFSYSCGLHSEKRGMIIVR